MTTTLTRVVTWQTTRGDKLNICRACEQRMASREEWARHKDAGEYCQVSRGEHAGVCDLCAGNYGSVEVS